MEPIPTPDSMERWPALCAALVPVPLLYSLLSVWVVLSWSPSTAPIISTVVAATALGLYGGLAIRLEGGEAGRIAAYLAWGVAAFILLPLPQDGRVDVGNWSLSGLAAMVTTWLLLGMRRTSASSDAPLPSQEEQGTPG